MLKQYTSPLETRFSLIDDALVIDLGRPCRILSSAPRGGGVMQARSIINHQVASPPVRDEDANGVAPPRWKDPARYLGRVAARVAAPEPCVALMTAVPLRRLVSLREEAGTLWVEGFVTVGVTNAVRAGEPCHQPAAKNRAGTINIILITNAALTVSAMVTAVQVITESKTAVLLSHRVPSWTGQPDATGTGTDVVVVASGDGPAVRYSGTHTEIGEAIGRIVTKAVTLGLRQCMGEEGSG